MLKNRIPRVMLIAAVMGFGSPIHVARADVSVADLAERLEQGSDFRMRVQAALQLGKSTTDRDSARLALEAALEDPNAAVRAAAAAALKVLDDSRALPALRRAEHDASAPVVAQIQSAIQTLGGRSKQSAPASRDSQQKPQVLVQLGRVRNATSGPVRGLVREFTRRSEENLQALSGVEVLPAREDSVATAERRKVPMVMLTGHLRQLQQTEEDGAIVYAAQVEYVLLRMPGNNIRAVISGSAKVRGSSVGTFEASQPSLVRTQAINAAIDSAMKRAREALVAAVQ